MHISINERMLIAQYHKQEKEIKELKDKLLQYRESFQTMKDNLTELKHLNKVLVNQISFLSSKQNQWANLIPSTTDEM